MENIKKGSVQSQVACVTALCISQVYDFANSVHRWIVHLRFGSVKEFLPLRYLRHLDFQRREARRACDLTTGVNASSDVQLHIKVPHQRIHAEKVCCDGKLVLFQS